MIYASVYLHLLCTAFELLRCQGTPEPIAFYPLNHEYNTTDISTHKNQPATANSIQLATGLYGHPGGCYQFSGTAKSYLEFINKGGLDTRYSMTLLVWIYPDDVTGPIFNYKANGIGVQLWLKPPLNLFGYFVRRDYFVPYAVESNQVKQNEWNYIGATYDGSTGYARLWIGGKRVAEQNIGKFELATQGYKVRMGAQVDSNHYFKGRIACLQIYNKALYQGQIEAAKDKCLFDVKFHYVNCYVTSGVTILSTVPSLDGDPKTRVNTTEKCALAVFKLGYKHFILRGGVCASSPTLTHVLFSTLKPAHARDRQCSVKTAGDDFSRVFEIVMFSEQICWQGWLSSYRSCYKVIHEPKTWTAAQVHCSILGANLIKITTLQQNYDVFVTLVRPLYPRESGVWIGLSRAANRQFYWTDGTKAEYTNWQLDSDLLQNSTKMNTYSGLWDDVEFDNKHKFICERAVPLSLQYVNISTSNNYSAMVTWNYPYTCNRDSVDPTVYVEFSNESHRSLVFAPLSSLSAKLINLQRNTLYKVRARVVSLEGGSPWSDYVNFITGYKESPRVQSLSSTVVSRLGGSLVLNCPLRGGSKLALSWYKDGVLISRNRTLHINNMTSQHEGQYHCIARNGVMASVRVGVLKTPKIKYVWVAPTGRVTAKKGLGLSLRCELQGNPYENFATFAWYKDGARISRGTATGNRLNLDSVGDEDFGDYKCEVSNQLGVSTKEIVVVSDSYVSPNLQAAIGFLVILFIISLIVIVILAWLLWKEHKKHSAKIPNVEPIPADDAQQEEGDTNGHASPYIVTRGGHRYEQITPNGGDGTKNSYGIKGKTTCEVTSV